MASSSTSWLSVSLEHLNSESGRSYSSTRRVRRGFPGESGLGKSTLINTLFNTHLYPEKEERSPSGETPKTVDIQAISAGGFWNALRTGIVGWR